VQRKNAVKLRCREFSAQDKLYWLQQRGCSTVPFACDVAIGIALSLLFWQCNKFITASRKLSFLTGHNFHRCFTCGVQIKKCTFDTISGGAQSYLKLSLLTYSREPTSQAPMTRRCSCHEKAIRVHFCLNRSYIKLLCKHCCCSIGSTDTR
jgi:hypothetical protein